MQSTMGIGHWPCAAPGLHNAGHTVSTFKGLPCVGAEWSHAGQFLRQTTQSGGGPVYSQEPSQCRARTRIQSSPLPAQIFQVYHLPQSPQTQDSPGQGPFRRGLILSSSRVSGCWQRQQPVTKNASQPEADPAHQLLA